MDAMAASPARGACTDPESARCPACGEGDLILTRVGRRGAEPARAVYCAGAYDGTRRRVIRRSCGFAGEAPASGGA